MHLTCHSIREQTYQDVHVSSTKPLMCFKICTASIKPVKSLLTKHEEGGLHTHSMQVCSSTYMAHMRIFTASSYVQGGGPAEPPPGLRRMGDASVGARRCSPDVCTRQGRAPGWQKPQRRHSGGVYIS
jgi:hypothetical protein